MEKVIGPFRGKYAWLSNFAAVPVTFGGILYPSVEHAYQAAKTHDQEIRLAVASHPSKGLKAFARSFQLRADWDMAKTEVMYNLLVAKFTQEPFKRLLLTTGDTTIVEKNYWHDNFWGSCDCPRCGNRGENRLGKMLMKIRQNLASVAMDWYFEDD